MNLNFFDFNCMLGPTNTNREPSFLSAQQLLAEMDRLGIAKASGFSFRLGLVFYADINDDTKQKILWDNAARIFNIT